MAEANLHLSEIGEEIVRSVRRKPQPQVSAEALAERLTRDRAAPHEERIKTLQSRYGLNANATLADIAPARRRTEPAFGNQPTASALRHVPIGRLTPGDLAILLMHREGMGPVLTLCVEVLTDDPLLEAQYYPGDLLKAAAQRVSTPVDPDETGQVHGLRTPLLSLCAQGVSRTWDEFEAEADRVRLSPDARMRHRKRIARGERAPDNDPFWRTVDRLNLLAEARRFLDPQSLLAVAHSDVTYARYRPMTGLEPVPLQDLEDKAILEHLEGPDTFYFVRETEFVIAEDPDRDGVRLHHYANAATMHHLGVAFDTAEEARHFTMATYGVPLEAWMDV